MSCAGHAGLDAQKHAGQHPPGQAPGAAPGLLLHPRSGFLFLSLLSAHGQALPCDHLALQRLFHAPGQGQRQTCPPRGQHREARQPGVLWGQERFEDFTWKHILDFYSCADCGRCSDQCPANAVKRPLSPRFISIKGRDFTFKHYPLRGKFLKADEPLIGITYSEDEIWSCTTCGACEEECPLGIEYIDKIVDLRRGMVDEGMVPQSPAKAPAGLGKTRQPLGQDGEEAGRMDQGHLPPRCDGQGARRRR
ncbi:MAG: (Fe-S)-binding protein [Desulfobacterales bacterium]|nr:(Fe-S)-binding protein [Desulfobacterales bacterium]